MSLQRELDERISRILTDCPTDLPDRATQEFPQDFALQDLQHLSDATWLVLLDLVAKQLRHHNLSKSSISQKSVRRRLWSVLMLVDDLQRYGLLDRRSPAYRSLDVVRQLVAKERLWEGL